MKKCRNLANKLIMSICAVVVAVSAFFYVPMEVSASSTFSDSVSRSFTPNTAKNWSSVNVYTSGLGSISDSNFGSEYVLLSGNFSYSANCSIAPAWRYIVNSLVINGKTYVVSYEPNPNNTGYLSSFSNSFDFRIVVDRADSYSLDALFSCNTFFNGTSSYTVSVDFSVSNLSLSYVSNIDGDLFQNGYNAGYSAGEQAGYGNGYSQGFADGEASVDTGAIYDEAFQAGKDSVNTDSYYDAGYDAGYQIGVQESYEIGYEAGYQNAMERVDSWGADTSDYPVFITSGSSESGFLSGYVYGNSQVYDEESIFLNFDINPNHIYRFDVKLGLPLQTSYSNVYGACTAVYFCAGGYDFFISPTLNLGQGIYESIYVRGDMLSSSFSKKGVVNVVSSSVTNPDMPASFSFNGFWHDVQVYDVGPIGNMQNHIANQTDQLTNGFDSSTGDSVNSDFSAGLNDYQTAEDSLFATAATGMKDFTFFDFASVPAMVTGMSFVGSVMSSWFNQAGGASGVGIVLSILFSVMLVAMVLGLYRWYQSRGGKK